MSTSLEPFTTAAERTRVLTEILHQGGGAPGVTLVGYVDRATLEVRAVRALATPDAETDDEECFPYQDIRYLNEALCALARECAPPRTFLGDRWSAMTGDLITLVCRDGPAVVTPAEVQFHWGWRYSNHLTSAFDGEVYAVTPNGWASLYSRATGPLPALPVLGPPSGTTPVLADAERELVGLSRGLLGPRTGECLLCYVDRMISEFGCDCRLRFARHYRDTRAPRAIGLELRLDRMGAFCDCEVFLNGYEAHRPGPERGFDWEGEPDWEDETEPVPMALSCGGVRAGSTQPCQRWRRQPRRR
jgi:hypothetical protein